MWTIRNLKTKAWAGLKKNYWQAFLASLVLLMVGGSGGASVNWNLQKSDFPEGIFEAGSAVPPYIIVFIIAAVLLGILFALAFRVLLGYPLEVGAWKYFVEGQKQTFDLNHLGYAFNKSRYLDIIKTMLWRAILNFLWFLLLIIPGIIAFYAYRMVPFILADNANIGYKQAVKLSVRMTRGHKFHIFLLDLSFLGWLLLGFLALFVGVLFVFPYINAAYAELYAVLRQSAIGQGLCTSDDLPS